MILKVVILWSVFLTLTWNANGQESPVTTTTAPSDDRWDKLDDLLNNLNSWGLSMGSSVIGYLLEELKTTQARLQELEHTVEADQAKIAQLSNDTHAVVASTLATQTQLEDLDVGSSFIRWGRKRCPVNTTLIYTGIAGGKQYTETGSGTNRLCLTNNPQFDDTSIPPYYGLLYGSEYEHIGNHQDYDVPCSVCLAPYSTTIMIPATLTCPQGWTKQYNGHLVSGYYGHEATEYDCLDGKPENYDSGLRDDNGLLFYPVLTKCGSLPCPPYGDDKVVTCVVCSK